MKIEKYNVKWDTQSKNSGGSMPVGGHDTGLNVWVENGDILFYIDRSGSFDENNQMLKLGRIRIKTTPDTLAQRDCEFCQELRLQQGCIEITGRAPGFPDVKAVIWVEVYRGVIHVNVSSSEPVKLDVSYENWRFTETEFSGDIRMAALGIMGYPGKITTKPDVAAFENEGIFFYHRNKNDGLIFDILVEQQGLEKYKNRLWNPQRNLTFGGFIFGENLISAGVTENIYAKVPYHSWTLRSQTPLNTHSVIISLHTSQSETVEEWKGQLLDLAGKAKTNAFEALEDTKSWWKDFWERSYISINPDSGRNDDKAWQVGRNYNLFRYMLGCNAFGSCPTKFNGGLFTSDPIYTIEEGYWLGGIARERNPDFRCWGGGSFTAQNQRLVYWPMLKSGDFEMMKPQFDFYLRALPNSELRTKAYWGHEGCCFTENHENFGLPGGYVYGWIGYDGDDKLHERTQFSDPAELQSPYVRYHYSTQLEFSFMILKYHEYCNSGISEYLPLIESSIRFFDEHYQYQNYRNTASRLDKEGNLVFFPSTALETYKNATNPTDLISALKAAVTALLSLPEEYLTHDKRSYYTGLLNRIPPIEFRIMHGKKAIAPAKSWTGIINSEIPQLYPVFPYEFYGIGREDLQVAADTWHFGVENKEQKDHISWHQDNIFCARLGLTDEASKYAIRKLEDSPRRFPAFWGPGHDWVPDHNWGGSGMIGLQEMLLQTYEEKIFIFPAWPKEWDVEFKLHAPMNTTVEVRYAEGVVEKLTVIPESRMQDIIMNPGF